LEIRDFDAQVLSTRGSEGVLARATVGLCLLPFRFDPALQEQTLQSGIQRAFLYRQHGIGHALD
jgi:hypothetical protein